VPKRADCGEGQAERKFLSGVGAQYESEVVLYGNSARQPVPETKSSSSPAKTTTKQSSTTH
jgi:hypothetical protein